ncbi:MAG: hypothetical protein ACRDRN_01330 [Sciscionella sp.]
MSITRTITIRLDDADHIALRRQAEWLRLRPGTLARMLVPAWLDENARGQGHSDAQAALDRLVRRSHRLRSTGAVGPVRDAGEDPFWQLV